MSETVKPIAIAVAIVLSSAIVSCSANNTITYIVKTRAYADNLNHAMDTQTSPMEVGCAWGLGQTGEAAVCAINQVRESKK